MAAVSINNKHGYIDKDGQVKIPLVYKYTDGFCDGLASVLVGKKYGFINKTGQMVIDPTFKGVGSFYSENLAPAKIDKKSGYIKSNGELAIEPKFKDASAFSESRAFVIEKKFQMINTNGEFINTQYQLTYANSFSEGISAVQVTRER